jgi:hypothetical protein
MADCDWLTQEFKQAEREYQELPESARPVVIPTVATAEDDTAGVEEVRQEATMPQDDGQLPSVTLSEPSAS